MPGPGKAARVLTAPPGHRSRLAGNANRCNRWRDRASMGLGRNAGMKKCTALCSCWGFCFVLPRFCKVRVIWLRGRDGAARPISPLEGEMPGRAEGGIAAYDGTWRDGRILGGMGLAKRRIERGVWGGTLRDPRGAGAPQREGSPGLRGMVLCGGGYPPLSATPTSPPQGGRSPAGGGGGLTEIAHRRQLGRLWLSHGGLWAGRPQADGTNFSTPTTPLDPPSEGWEMPSETGTSGKSKGLTPSRQATLMPYWDGFERRWWWV